MPGTAANAGADYDLQDVPQLEALAGSLAQREFPPLTERQRFLIGPIDPHLQLERCNQPVRATLASARHMRDRATVELKCPNLKSWHIYVQIRHHRHPRRWRLRRMPS